jgi:CDP-diacylglycerol pyrophosphatase
MEKEPSIISLIEKGVMSMSQKASDQGWQTLQSSIEGFFEQALRSDKQQIEYKPRFIVQLLEMPSENQRNERREISK